MLSLSSARASPRVRPVSAGRAQRVHVPVDGALRDLQLLRQRRGRDPAARLQEHDQRDKPVSTHSFLVSRILSKCLDPRRGQESPAEANTCAARRRKRMTPRIMEFYQKILSVDVRYLC